MFLAFLILACHVAVLSTLKDLLQLLGVSDLNRIHDLDGFLVYVDETVKRRKGGEYSMVDFSYSVETKGEAFNSEMVGSFLSP